ncbi:MAG: hypothetical protein JJ850_07700 [Kordiimonadaceae bacterium]|nr:hypothetical protein [Kordiimonadaceae bacterium]MBO6569011.1 hypothetical protein [Kordiimonadaceae bacterium]MBO6964486.1 hypothetical protein [Kordiimonadaceae bacterium]
MFGAQEINFRQLSLFSLIVGIGLLLTGFIVNEIYRNAVNDARDEFRDASGRFLARLSADLTSINASVTRFGDVFALTGEPEGRALAEFVDSYTSINSAEAVTTLLVVAADERESHQKVQSLIGEINENSLVSRAGEQNARQSSYYLAYVGLRERDVSEDGGASLVGLDLARFEQYNQLLDQVLSVGQTDFELVTDKLSPVATPSGKLVIVSPFRSEIGNAFLVEVVHLEVLSQRSGTSALLGGVQFVNRRAGSSSGEPEPVLVKLNGIPDASDAPAGGAWTAGTTVNVGLGGLEVTLFASEQAYQVNMQNVLRVGMVGVLITAILSFLAYDQIRRSNRVVEIVNRRTRALKEAHSELENHYRMLQNLNSEVDDARRAAEAANLAKSEFLATMSHELRTPLNAILGFSEILETETLGPIGDKRYIEYAGDINSSGKHLLSIINDILDLAKLEAGRVRIEKKPLDPKNLVEGVMGLLSHQADEKGLEFSFNMADAMPNSIQGDELRLRQVLINLASNAIKFTKEGSVSIRMHPKPFKNGAAAWVLEVQDTGIGIPEEKQSVLFDRFTQVDTTHSRQHGGVGLGLAICRELVNRMDGIISVRSIQNVGTTIRVQLPLDLADSDDDDGALI